MEMLNIDQAGELKSAIEAARNDDTPYIGMIDDELHVIGDPNKTEVKAADYVVRFAFPNTEEFRAKAQIKGYEIGKETEDGAFFACERVYKNIYLTPRRIGAVVSVLAKIEQFLYSVSENGDIRDLSYEEMQSVLFTMNGELTDATYEVVATVLRIPYDDMDFMLPVNTIMNAVKIAYNNPSAVNEADLFFG